MNVDAATVGMPLGEAVAYTAQMDLLRAAHASNIPVTAQLLEQINMLSESFALANLQLEGARLGMELMNDPFSILSQELERLDEMLRAGVISWETYGTAASIAMADAAGATLQAVGQQTSMLARAFEDNKAFSLANAVVKGMEAVVSSYAAGARIGGPVVGAAFAATAAAATAKQIAAIASASKNSKSPLSGSGGAGGRGGGQAQTQQAVTINLHGDSYSQNSVEGLLAQLNEAISDGHKLIIRTV